MVIISGVVEWLSIPHETRKSHQQGESRMRNTTPKRKTSIYVDEQNIPKIQKFQRQYNLSLNRVVNICLTKYLDEMRVWIWCYGTRNPSAAHRRPVDHSECRGFENPIMWFYWWPSSSSWGWLGKYKNSECINCWRKTSFQYFFCHKDKWKSHR